MSSSEAVNLDGDASSSAAMAAGSLPPNANPRPCPPWLPRVILILILTLRPIHLVQPSFLIHHSFMYVFSHSPTTTFKPHRK